MHGTYPNGFLWNTWKKLIIEAMPLLLEVWWWMTKDESTALMGVIASWVRERGSGLQ